jgi:tRNA1(Val) A37 N6-methylase TrmN6
LAANFAPMAGDRRDVTDDAALGGRLRLLQPRTGHRFGHDAILLAAATPARDGDRAADLGAGVGTAGLALAARAPGVRVSLIEIDPSLAVLAAENAERNGLADRIGAVTLDVTDAASFAGAGLQHESYDVVLMNPPFHDPERHRASPDQGRRAAHGLPHSALAHWIDAAARLLRPGGTLTVIFRADGAAQLLAELDREFGAVALLPVYPKPGASAIRVIVGAVKASRAPFMIRPGLTLAAEDGKPTQEADAILRHGAALPPFE